MTKDQAKAIIRAITGWDADTPKTLDIAWEIGNSLLAACDVLDPEHAHANGDY